MYLKGKINNQHLLIAGLLIAFGVIGRIALHDFFARIINPLPTQGFPVPLDVFFIIATVSLFAGVLLGKYYAFFVPLCIIVFTDMFYLIVDPSTASLWTTWLFFFTWSGYVVIALFGFVVKQKTTQKKYFVPFLAGAGVLGILFFDIWTNFGFWLSFSKLGFYPQTLGGLATVYIGGIPSMIWHLLSTTSAIICVAIPIVYLKKLKLLEHTVTVKPAEKYLVLSITVVLFVASILTALV